jgi:hypothetical protein
VPSHRTRLNSFAMIKGFNWASSPSDRSPKPAPSSLRHPSSVSSGLSKRSAKPNAPVVSAVRRALQIEDVVEELCRWPGPPELACLMRSAKLFKIAAQRELWRTHAKVEALLLALPGSAVARDEFDNKLVGRSPYSRNHMLTFPRNLQNRQGQAIGQNPGNSPQ